MKPRHVIVATGVSGIPIMAAIPGLDAFEGAVMHSGSYTSGTAWKGRKALVLGTGNSGHDVAQDLCVQRRRRHHRPAQPDLYREHPRGAEGLCDLQRGPAVRGLRPARRLDALSGAAAAYQLSTAEMREADRALLKGLEARGFRLTFGEDDTGFQMMYLRRGGGYYFNVGCSDMIVDGRSGCCSTTLSTASGRRRPAAGRHDEPADLVVVATGYESQQEFVRATLGDAVADRIGPVWGFDDGGELRNMWRPTAQDGLWFTAGSLAQCRIYSRYLALQIKAREDGLLPGRALE